MMVASNRKKRMEDRPPEVLLFTATSFKFFTLDFNYIRLRVVAPVYPAWSESQESRAWAASLESVAAPVCPEASGCRLPVGIPESAARTGFDLTLNQESCDVEFPFANPPWVLWGLEAGQGQLQNLIPIVGRSLQHVPGYFNLWFVQAPVQFETGRASPLKARATRAVCACHNHFAQKGDLSVREADER